MKIKKNDKVKILTGKDSGKVGKVLQIFPKEGRVSVEGLNILIKHLRPQKQGEKGQRIEFPGLINISNVILVCPKCGKEFECKHTKECFCMKYILECPINHMRNRRFVTDNLRNFE